MAKNPGKLLSFWDNPYRQIPGSGGSRYVHIHTGETVTRARFLSEEARAFGFRNYRDYLSFSQQFSGGLGGLHNLSIADVKRVKHMLERYEKDNHLPRGTATEHNPLLASRAKAFLENPYYKSDARTRYVSRLLDAVGVPNYTRAFFAGAS